MSLVRNRFGIRKPPTHLPLFLLFCSCFLLAQNSDIASLHGTVRDASGTPVANASLILQNQNSPTSATTTTDAHGNYSFTSVAPGKYSLHATKKGYADAAAHALDIEPKEAKTQDLVLQSDPMAAPQFFDEPQFAVSGVVDTTALGGHGSDTVVRTRESIAKDTAKLSKSGPTISGAPPEVESSLREGNYKQAKEQTQRLIASGENAELHHLLADIDEKSGDSLAAVHEYQRAAETTPSENNLFDWGSELLLHHAAEPAKEVFAKGNHLFPQSSRMLLGLGASYFGAGLYDQAVQKICQASDLNPNDPSPYLFLGKMQSAENVSSPELIEHLHRFASLQPQNALANYYYAVALWKQNRANRTSDSEIESLLNNAIRLDPNFAPAELQLGILKSEQGDEASALTHFNRATQIDPLMQEAHFRLAPAYRKLGQPDKAKEEVRLYQELSKKSAEQIDRERREIPQFVYTLRNEMHLEKP